MIPGDDLATKEGITVLNSILDVNVVYRKTFFSSRPIRDAFVTFIMEIIL